MFDAIRRASSIVSAFAISASLGFSLAIGKRLPSRVLHDVAASDSLNRPRWLEAAWHRSDSPSLLRTAILNCGDVLHGRRL